MFCNNIIKGLNSHISDTFTFQAPNPSNYNLIKKDKSDKYSLIIKDLPLDNIISVYSWISYICHKIFYVSNKVDLFEKLKHFLIGQFLQIIVFIL